MLQGVHEMSILNIVEQALKSNPDIVLAPSGDFKNLARAKGTGFIHTLEFFVAPNGEGLYEIDELNRFMDALVPGLEPKLRVPFEILYKLPLIVGKPGKFLQCGKLCFDEEVGHASIVTQEEYTITDEDLKAHYESELGFVDGRRTFSETSVFACKRMILVYPFPNEAIIRDQNYLSYETLFMIRLSELRKYKPVK